MIRFQKDTAKGNKARKAKPDKTKNFTLTPASHATVNPPAPINKAVPKSGCVATKINGAIKATIGRTKILSD